MITRYDASQGVVEAANAAMDETSDSDRCREIWEPIANALLDSVPQHFERDWPDLWGEAKDAGPDFVGVTSDTRRVVVWGRTHPRYREFAIL